MAMYDFLMESIPDADDMESSVSFEAITSDEMSSSSSCSENNGKIKEPIFHNFLAVAERDDVQVGEAAGVLLASNKPSESEEILLDLKLGCASCVTKKRKACENSAKLTPPSSSARGIKRMKYNCQEVSLELKLGFDPWVIKKTIQTSDVGDLARLLLAAGSVKHHILTMWDAETIEKIKDGLGVVVWDKDTNSEHQMEFKQWKSGSYVLIKQWTNEFVKRRDLKRGDEVGLYWDQTNSRFNFSVLKRL
ncbi:B3 domain-containing protein At2g33720-like [Corylus avellana]|uniref:B3 domain-containing protein At2g33720-like n=1 Tax=Corylus avellana TaxID=13451 RepID=UPI00286D57B3|nr:B3 domain-containing protein At2g33720-like [Corylus avellana]